VCRTAPAHRGDVRIKPSSIDMPLLSHATPRAALDGIAAKAISWTIDPAVRYHEGHWVVPDSTRNSCRAGES